MAAVFLDEEEEGVGVESGSGKLFVTVLDRPGWFSEV